MFTARQLSNCRAVNIHENHSYNEWFKEAMVVRKNFYNNSAVHQLNKIITGRDHLS